MKKIMISAVILAFAGVTALSASSHSVSGNYTVAYQDTTDTTSIPTDTTTTPTDTTQLHK